MKNLVTRGLIAALVFSGAFGALLAGRAAADGAEQPALQADRSLLEALGKSDAAAAGKLLEIGRASCRERVSVPV
jgi:hypothetical protein